MNLPETEARSGHAEALETLDPLGLARRFAEADAQAAAAVAAAEASVAEGIRRSRAALAAGGRILFVGAGTSGRLAVIEAAECRPTFGSERVLGVLAGGADAFVRPREGAEDDPEGGAQAVQEHAVDERDFVCGVAASGRTPFVWGALEEASRRGAATGLVCCATPPAPARVDVVIRLETGPEVLTGSTRLKAGTATKCVLNALTTGAMALSGKVYEGLMVDVQATNAKLRDRAARIVTALTGGSPEEVAGWLEATGGAVKLAALMGLRGGTVEEARARLEGAGGDVRAALEGDA